MKQLVGLLLLLCFSMVGLTPVKASPPPLEKQIIEVTITQDFQEVSFEPQVSNLIEFAQGVEISPGDSFGETYMYVNSRKQVQLVKINLNESFRTLSNHTLNNKESLTNNKKGGGVIFYTSC